ncbi:MAG: NAD(P)-dependent oxidoreductase, partial [Hyphomicrobiaceae bacterium]
MRRGGTVVCKDIEKESGATMTKPTIGFIGLGLMGQGFIKRLLHSGYPVIGLDVVAEKCTAVQNLGGEIGQSPADLARRADIIEICVTTPSDVARIVEGDDGLATVSDPRARVVVDHSTTDITTTQRLSATLLASSGIGLVDAPVSGGPLAAESGKLAIMAGGSAADIAIVEPVLTQLGTFTHMGPVTAGQATKLVNQALVLSNYCVIAEALRLAEAYGVDAAKVPSALATGHAGSNL